MKLTRARLEDRLDQALNEIHELWGAVPLFCDKCDALTEGDAEICPNGHSLDDFPVDVFVFCPECDARTDWDAAECDKCGAAFEGGEECTGALDCARHAGACSLGVCDSYNYNANRSPV